MNKLLRNFALTALVAGTSLSMSSEIKIEKKWFHDDFQHGLDAGWGGATSPQNATCSRLGTGYNGKILTTNHKENAIIGIDANGWTVVKKLNPVTADRWNGTIVTVDDAGNIIFNYGFTDAVKSFTQWGVISAKDGNIYDINMAEYPAELAADQSANRRIDQMGHVVGDVLSAEGGIGYVALKGWDYAYMIYFQGDGTKPTSVRGFSSDRLLLGGGVPFKVINGDNQLATLVPRYNSVKRIMAASNPANQFYLTFGALGELGTYGASTVSYTRGCIGFFTDDGEFSVMEGIGNRGALALAKFELNGNTYFVRSYIDPNGPLATEKWIDPMDKQEKLAFSAHRNVMNFGIFDAQGRVHAQWQDSRFRAYYGNYTFAAEQIDESTANIYIYGGSVSADECTNPGGLQIQAGMFTVTEQGSSLTGEGTEASPYLIGTAADLGIAWRYVKPGTVTYFKQTADIDMAGVTEYNAINGCDGGFWSDEESKYLYNSAINYDGDYHLIKNFAPVDRKPDMLSHSYYCTSVFGVATGTFKNFGVVGANIQTSQPAGILGAYAGHADVASFMPVTKFENVFVQGELVASGAYTGGMFGTNGSEIEVTNCYVQANISAPTLTAGICGRVRNALKVNNSYVAGRIAAADAKDGIVTASDREGEKVPAITFTEVVAFSDPDGAFDASLVPTTGEALYVEEDGKAEAIAKIQAWDAYNKKAMFNELPALNWQADGGAGIDGIFTDNDSEAPAVYYNLQGVEVANPESGLYIVKRGNKVTKEVIRK